MVENQSVLSSGLGMFQPKQRCRQLKQRMVVVERSDGAQMKPQRIERKERLRLVQKKKESGFSLRKTIRE
jgi:hypothetical protein